MNWPGLVGIRERSYDPRYDTIEVQSPNQMGTTTTLTGITDRKQTQSTVTVPTPKIAPPPLNRKGRRRARALARRQ